MAYSRRNFIKSAALGVTGLTIIPNKVLGKAYGHKSLDDVDGYLLDIAPPRGILNPTFKTGNHQTCPKQRPRQLREKENDGLHPVHLE